MNNSSDSSVLADPLDAIVADYLQQVESGTTPDREALLAAHPELGERLRAFFADLDRLGPQACAFHLPDMSLPDDFGDYEIESEIGRGGMGVVYQARQVSLNRPVALKMILGGWLVDPAAVARFRDEAETAARLDHPNIVPIYEVGDQRGHPYFSMKRIDGQSLSKCLEQYRDPKAAVELLIKVCRAVQHAHQRGVLHRDLKPGNILVDADGEPHVTDFGLARRIEEARAQTLSGVVVGTPESMAPEQAAGAKDLTTAVDVYGLGAVLYALLTGRPPFQTDGVYKTLRAVIEEQPIAPTRLRKDAPRDLEVICLKCLSKLPARRYPSAEAVADDLERWHKGEPIQARRVGRIERFRMWAKRRPAAAALVGVSVAASLVIVVGAILFSLGLARQNRQIREQNAQIGGQNQQIQKQIVQITRQADDLTSALDTAKTERGNAEKARGEASERAADWQREFKRAESELNRAEEMLYAQQLQAAMSASQRGDYALALEHLDSCKRAHRGWEHALLRTWLDNHKLWQEPQGGCIAFSPDGRLLAVGTHNGPVRIRDASTGALVRELPSFDWEVVRVAFSPNGRQLLSWSGDRVRIDEVATGKTEWSIRVDASAIGFRPDGQIVVVRVNYDERAREDRRYDTSVLIWDALTGDDLPAPPADAIYVTRKEGPLAFGLADSKTVRICLGGWGVKTWTTREGWKTLASEEDLERRHGTNTAYEVAASPDRRRVAFRLHTHEDGNIIKVMDAITRTELLTFQPGGGSFDDLSFSPDGLMLAAAFGREFTNHTGDNSVRIWDVGTGREIHRLYNHFSRVYHMAFSHDGSRVASLSIPGQIRIWDLNNVDQIQRLRPVSPLAKHLEFTPKGDRLLTVSDHGVAVWDVQANTEGKIALQTQLGHSALSSDGRFLAMGQGNLVLPGALRVYEVATGNLRFELRGPTPRKRVDAPFERDFLLTSLAFSPDGKWILAGCDDGWVYVWDAGTGDLSSKFEGYPEKTPPKKEIYDPIKFLTFSPDAKRIAVVNSTAVVVHTTATWRHVATLQTERNAPWSARFVPGDGYRVVCLLERSAHLWDVENGRELDNWTISSAADPGVSPVVWNRDGSRMAQGRGRDATVWDTTNGKEILHLADHPGPIVDLAFAPDGERIVVLSGLISDQSFGRTMLTIWHAKTGRKLLELREAGLKARRICFSPDGRQLAVAGHDQLWVLQANSSSERLRLPNVNHLIHAAFTPDGKRLFTVGGPDIDEVRVWSVPDGREVLRFHAHEIIHVPGWGNPPVITALLVSPDGKRLITAGFDKTVRIRDIESGKELHVLHGHDYQVTGIACSPDGAFIASVNPGQFSGANARMIMWDARTGNELWRKQPFDHGFESETIRVAFTADGQRLITQDRRGGTVVWNPATGKHLSDVKGEFPGKPEQIISQVVSNDGRYRVEVGRDLNASSGAVDLVDVVQEKRRLHAEKNPGVRPTLIHWHRDRIAAGRKADCPYGVAFHMSRMAALKPGDIAAHFEAAKECAKAELHDRAALHRLWAEWQRWQQYR